MTKDDFDKLRNKNKQTSDFSLLIIVTYLVEFDKVHYPLSLSLSSNTSVLSKSRNTSNAEVESLKQQVLQLLREKDEKETNEKRFEMILAEKNKELYFLQQEKDDLQSKVDKIIDQMDKIIEQLENQAQNNTIETNKQVEELKKNKEKLEYEVEKYKKEVKSLKEETKKDKSRIFQLESELKTLFEKSRSSRSKSIGNGSLQKSYSNYRESSEINQKINHLKILLDRAKD